jgi:hypothetical protein
MRYYHYLSSAKVEMLYGQLGLGTVGGKTEGGVDFKVAKATRTTETSGEVNIYQKLAAVEEWIYGHEPVGSVDEPEPWISGRLELVAMTRGPKNRENATAGAIIYCGRTASGARIVFVGSQDHLVGAPPEPPVSVRRLGPSEVVSATRLLGRLIRQDSDQAPRTIDAADLRMPQHAVEAVGRLAANAQSIGVCEFLAKRFRSYVSATNGHDGPLLSVGSPLYVALMD